MRTMFRSCLATLLCLIAFSARAEVIDIDNARLEQLLKSGVPIVDIRLQSEWEETGIVAGSKLLTFFDERGRYDAGAWLDKVKAVAKANEPVIVICRTGNRTGSLVAPLEKAGYKRVINVAEGMFGGRYGPGWIKSGLPLRKFVAGQTAPTNVAMQR